MTRFLSPFLAFAISMATMAAAQYPLGRLALISPVAIGCHFVGCSMATMAALGQWVDRG